MHFVPTPYHLRGQAHLSIQKGDKLSWAAGRGVIVESTPHSAKYTLQAFIMNKPPDLGRLPISN